jgi:uncharacterized YccA/Bax inhibitor family protein
METSNPVFGRFKNAERVTGAVMTIDGALNKSLLMMGLLVAIAALVWYGIASAFIPENIIFPLVIGSVVVGLILGLVMSFFHNTAPYLVPIYAAVEGVLIGAISLLFETMFPGIVLQAVALTLAVAIVMLVLYRSRLIKVDEKFRTIMFVAIAAIGIVYIISMVLSFFGTTIPYIHEGGPIGIAFSLIVVGVAAFSLLLDFDFMERMSKERVAEKYEWLAAFGLMVTLIWLYIEILKLLAKIRGRD